MLADVVCVQGPASQVTAVFASLIRAGLAGVVAIGVAGRRIRTGAGTISSVAMHTLHEVVSHTLLLCREPIGFVGVGAVPGGPGTWVGPLKEGGVSTRLVIAALVGPQRAVKIMQVNVRRTVAAARQSTSSCRWLP